MCVQVFALHSSTFSSCVLCNDSVCMLVSFLLELLTFLIILAKYSVLQLAVLPDKGYS